MDRRTLLAIVLSIAVLFIYQNFFAPPSVKKPAPTQQEAVVTPQPAQQAPAAAPQATPPPAALKRDWRDGWWPHRPQPARNGKSSWKPPFTRRSSVHGAPL